MTKSLNPNASPSAPQSVTSGLAPAPRRNVVAAIAATIIGGFVGFVPFAAGVATFLDPLLRRKKMGGEAGAKLAIRVASLDALPADGTPVQVPVMDDLTDAWNREANQPIGAVYLSRQ